MFSRSGAGLQDKPSTAQDMSSLFGGGGHQDGATALIRTNENARIEEDMALGGMGERVIDENIIPNNVANLNTEFNFSAVKTGAVDPTDLVIPGEEQYGRITGSLPNGDTNVALGGDENVFQVTLQALQSSFGQHYNMDASKGPSTGGGNPFASMAYATDPFSSTSARRGEEFANDDDRMYGEETQSDKNMQQSVDFFLTTPTTIYPTSKADNFNENTGLRRRNTKTCQSRQLERVAQKKDIMAAIDKSTDLHAEVMKHHFDKSFKTGSERDAIYGRIHNTLNLYTASQVGIGEVSSESYKNSSSGRKRKSKNDKLNSTLVGV